MRYSRVLLLGDEIRLSYHHRVADILRAEEGFDIECCGPDQSTGSSADIAEQIQSWLDEYDPDALHFNAGHVDAQWRRAEQRNNVPVVEYELNLQHIIDACKPRLGGDIVFATTTTVIDEKPPAPGLPLGLPSRPNDLVSREIVQYNIAAQQVMLRNDVLINHLDRLIEERDDEYLAADGISLTPAGVECTAMATANCIRHLWH